MKITKDYAGLKDIGWAYELQGDLISEDSIEIELYKTLVVTGDIRAETFIKARRGIEAGSGIESGSSIESGNSIKAGSGIEAGSGIRAGEGIEARWGIEAGRGIKAGLGIKAGRGIKAGLYITAKQEIIVGMRIFAGIASWLKVPTREQQLITATKVTGEVCYGIVEIIKEIDKEVNIKMLKSKAIELGLL